MAPRNWKFLPRFPQGHAAYLLRSMSTESSGLDRAPLERLVALQRAGRLSIRFRDPRSQVNTKLYVIESGPDAWRGLAGSSNLSESGLTNPDEFNQVFYATAAAQTTARLLQKWHMSSSLRADGVWKELLDSFSGTGRACGRNC